MREPSEVVERIEKLLDDVRLRARNELGALLDRPLAIVVVLGGLAEESVLRLGELPLELGVRRRAAGRVAAHLERPLEVLGVVVHASSKGIFGVRAVARGVEIIAIAVSHSPECSL